MGRRRNFYKGSYKFKQRKDMTILEVKNLTKRFGALTAVDDVNLKVEENELVALIGPNGAGKTTFFNLIAGKLTADSGKIIFKGEDITNEPPCRRARKGINLSFQIPSLFASFSTFGNVRVSALVYARKHTKFFTPIDKVPGLKENSSSLLDKVGIPEHQWFSNCDLLPGGEKKKLDIAVSIAQEPQLLLLDEPTAGLGLREADKILELIKWIKDYLKSTIIFTEHDLEVVFSTAQRIIVMNEGKIVADGEPDEVRENDMVRKIYGW